MKVKSMTSSREQTSQRKEASLDSDFLVHFIGKMEDSPVDSNETYIFQLFYCPQKFQKLSLITFSPNLQVTLQKHGSHFTDAETELKRVSYSVSPNKKLIELAGRGGGGVGGRRWAPPTFIFKLQISHCSPRASHIISKATEGSLPISQNKPLISLQFQHYLSVPFISQALPNEGDLFPYESV